LKVAFHNPWPHVFGNRLFKSVERAGAAIGVTFVDCANETDIEVCRPELVISTTASVAKIVDLPSYLILHEARSHIVRDLQRLRNIFSYDGYLTVFDSLAAFAEDFCHGVGRPEAPGFFHTTPLRTDVCTDWRHPDRRTNLRVAYCGSNRARPMPGLFRALEAADILRIYGPEAGWQRESFRSYCGAVPFDLMGPQRIYAATGIGLALTDPARQREAIVSQRLFEICSVGAVAICPDLPWIRRWFGDAVLYFNPAIPHREIAARVVQHYEFCRDNPDLAEQIGARAREIFEATFAADRMVAQLLEYHDRNQRGRQIRRAALPSPPHVSVVMRCGGRSLDMVRHAVDSIRNQTYCCFTIIFACYRDIDLSAILSDVSGAITGYDQFLIPGGSRARMLFEGVRRVVTDYFAILDDDDFLLRDHFEELFRAGWRVDPRFDMAFAGVIEFDYPVRIADGLISTRNISRFGFSRIIEDIGGVLEVFTIHCFVARRDLLTQEMLAVPDMNSGEDSLLVGYVSWRSKPIFSYRPTAFYRRDGPDASNWQRDPRRKDDELSFAFRGSLAWAPRWLPAASLGVPMREANRIGHMLGAARFGEYVDRLEPGEVGLRLAHGIVAQSGRPGSVCLSPQIDLAPGTYRLSLFIEFEAQGATDATGEKGRARPWRFGKGRVSQSRLCAPIFPSRC
jgi:hypothetical protein